MSLFKKVMLSIFVLVESILKFVDQISDNIPVWFWSLACSIQL